MSSAPPHENVPAVEFPDEKFEVKGIKGKKSKLSVGKYQIKSTVEMRGGREMHTWCCSYKNCEEKFRSSHKCGAHLNEHLNRLYHCPKCRYQTYSLDGHDHHVCFSGPKTQGMKRKPEKRPIPEKKKIKPTSTMTRGDASGELSRRIKEEDPEIIVLE